MTTTTTASFKNDHPIVVVSRMHPATIRIDGETGEPIIDTVEHRNDQLDEYNHTRRRRAKILKELEATHFEHIRFEQPPVDAVTSHHLEDYQSVHSKGLLEFLRTAWDQWLEWTSNGDPEKCRTEDSSSSSLFHQSIALVPGDTPLPRLSHSQRPSKHILGQVGWYCTDTCTPIVAETYKELLWDAAVVRRAVQELVSCTATHQVIYALPTHPGHHAAHDSFGGYCYVNHVAMAARLLLQEQEYSKILILDVDYHCGNGTASIFYEDPSVYVISIHCHPDHDYPFHNGFEDERGAGEGMGTTLHVPLLPGTSWNDYQKAMKEALATCLASSFQPDAMLVSLGLDTHDADPCSERRAGFCLRGDDYVDMGASLATFHGETPLPTLFLQEGGYYLDKVPRAVADVLVGFMKGRQALY